MNSHVASAREYLVNDRSHSEVKTVSELVADSKIFVEDGNHGENRPRQDEFCAQGVPFLRPPDLKEGRVDFGNCDHINEDGFRRVRKGIGKPGDIILTHRATVGRIAITDDSAPSVFVTNPGTTIWRSLDPGFLDQRYLYFFMSSKIFQDRLFSEVGHTSTFDYVSLTQQRTLPVVIPDIQTQRDIAHILGALDDKIELNRKFNETLEAMAKALFKSWFVDFDPVRAKAEGRPTGLPDEISDLFPDSFEESELGEIPSGWEVAELGELSTISGGKQLESGKLFGNGRFPVYGANGIMGFCENQTHERFAIIFGRVGAYCGSVKWEYGGVWVNNNASSVIPLRHNEFVLQWMLETDYSNYRTGSAQPFIPNGALSSSPVLRPSDSVTDLFCEVLRPLRLRQKNNDSTSQLIAQLRDALLPKLITGEIRIPDAERMLEEVGV